MPARNPGGEVAFRQVGREMGIVLEEGVYAAVLGASYETPAEIRYLRAIGADLVGMSTVPEVIVANHLRIPVLGVSCVTNMAAGNGALTFTVTPSNPSGFFRTRHVP